MGRPGVMPRMIPRAYRSHTTRHTSPSEALELTTSASSFPTWTAKLPLLPAGSWFKLVIRRSSGGTSWEPIDGNRHWPANVGGGDCIQLTYGDPHVTKVKAIREDGGISDESTERSPVAVIRETRRIPGKDVSVEEVSDTEVPAGDDREGRSEELKLLPRVPSLSPNHTQFIFDNPGDIDDFYELDEAAALGSGTFGTVSKGVNRQTGIRRAIKTIHKHRIGDVDAFKTEVEIMKMMDHPNVIKLFEYYENAHDMYLVMELCSGGDLFDRIIEERKFSEPKALTTHDLLGWAWAFVNT